MSGIFFFVVSPISGCVAWVDSAIGIGSVVSIGGFSSEEVRFIWSFVVFGIFTIFIYIIVAIACYVNLWRFSFISSNFLL